MTECWKTVYTAPMRFLCQRTFILSYYQPVKTYPILFAFLGIFHFLTPSALAKVVFCFPFHIGSAEVAVLAARKWKKVEKVFLNAFCSPALIIWKINTEGGVRLWYGGGFLWYFPEDLRWCPLNLCFLRFALCFIKCPPCRRAYPTKSIILSYAGQFFVYAVIAFASFAL